MKKMKIAGLICLLLSSLNVTVSAQQTAIKRTSEEIKELFGYCDKPALIRELKITADIADKIGEIDHWARQQQASIDANTNEVYATTGELMQEVSKRYKALGLAADQVKSLSEAKRIFEISTRACPVTELHPNHLFDTLIAARALQLYKTKYRKQVIDKLGVNGRQADMLLEIEVWKQKEAVAIAAIPESDFNRIRKTVAMYAERQRRWKVAGIGEEQFETMAQFFDQNTL
ncbi:MAG TPA: hypothetical protein VGE25_15025 [Sediminibacterium sp.]